MKIKMIIQNTGRVIVMILALYSVHTMLACGGSGGNDGINNGDGDVGETPPTTNNDYELPDGYGVYGQIDDVIVGVSEPNTVGKITLAVIESNPNDQFDEGDLGLSFSLARTAATNGSYVSVGFCYFDYQNFVSNQEYNLSLSLLGSAQNGTLVTVTASDGVTTTRYDVESVSTIFSTVNMGDIGSQITGTLIVGLSDSNGSLTIAFNTTLTSQFISF